MNVEEEMVCRLCLRVVHDEFVLIEETARQVLVDVLQVKMNLDVSNNPLMCNDCAEIVRRALSFKSTCKNSEEFIFDIREDETNINLCRFCTKIVDGNNIISLDVLMKENTFSDMIKEFVTQMGLNIIRNSIICLHCQDNMESYFKFLQNCCNTEEKINTYVQSKAVRSGEKIMLHNVVEIFFKCIKEEETLSSIIEGIKQEFMEDRVIDAFVYQNGETSNCILCTCDMKDSSCLRCHAKLEEDALDTKGITTETVTWEVNNNELRIETENSLIKQEDTLNEMTGEQTEAKSGMCICKITRKTCIRCNSQFEIVSTKPKLYKCNLCPYQGMGIKSHMLKHRDISEVRVYQCDKCLFQTKRKQDLKIHLFTHGIHPEVQVYKCDICEYHTKYKSCLKSHLLTHKGFSEVQVIYQCDICEYQSKQKRYLTQHLLTHEDFSNIQMFQCVSCEYQTKRKGDLKKHVMTHKNSAEVHSYQCDSCEYQTSQKRYLRRHLLIHNSFFLTQNMFQCKSCEYRTKYKHYMKSHLLAHHSPSETQVYQCDSCEYQTKHRGSLLNHKLTHKDFSEVKTYQCDSCKYQTKRNGDLKKHLKTHKNLPHALITTL